jgi:CubicO group peptidase (beta-lactamase class C family)
MKRWLLLATFLFPVFALAQPPVWQKDFEAYLDSVIATYKVPGIAVEVVDENGPVFQITRGYRDIENQKPVTTSTLYAIGSTTKAFTGVVLAQLRDDKKLDFETTVQTYWPTFQINDPKVSPLLTIHDLMSHWTGVGRHDLAWYQRTDLDRASFLAMIPKLPVSTAPRTAFIYNNYMIVAAAHVAELITGQTWEDLLQSRVFNALGMTGTNFSTTVTKASADHAQPYKTDETFKTTQVPFLDIGFANPAGGIYSNLDDMAKWVQMHLNSGMAGGKQVVSAASLAETYKPYATISPTASYGMGWGVVNKDGETILSHDGGIDGFTANVSLLPQRHMGVVVLQNESQVVSQFVAARLWQYIRGVPTTDTVKTGYDLIQAAAAAAKTQFADPAVIKPANDLSAFAGKYCQDAYGEVIITAPAPDRLHIHLTVVDSDLLPSDTLKFFMPGVFEPTKFIEFKENGGKVYTLEWALEASAPAPLQFKRCD